MSIYQTAVKRPITTILIFLGIAIFGLFSLTRLTVAPEPDIETNSIMVMTPIPVRARRTSRPMSRVRWKICLTA